MKGGSPTSFIPRQRSNHVVTQAADRRRRELRLIGANSRPRMSDVGGNSRFPAPAAYDQREREFGDGRLAGRARWQAALSCACGMVRPAIQRSLKRQYESTMTCTMHRFYERLYVVLIDVQFLEE
ncbi:hypothetical protein [Desulfosporosinus sp. BICA1-9]|uniref:hypothetical protein n=1 Tax=Desulfosporosinus sp. BICA1-9 TaxID=1531958 RepID=UPI0025C2D539|nr:hypothetical protein [Desulfosporosinus sp. BICA1-9]